MARFGKLPVTLPKEVTFKVADGEVVISGPKGTLKRSIPRNISVTKKEEEILIERKNEVKQTKASQGTMRAHIINMIQGVVKGWSKELEIVGAGYKAELKGDELTLSIGFSHPVLVKAPEGIKFTVEKSAIKIEGIDKELVGEIAAKIRSYRKPEPYKGAGIKYVGEEIRRKAGKQATTTT